MEVEKLLKNIYHLSHLISREVGNAAPIGTEDGYKLLLFKNSMRLSKIKKGIPNVLYDGWYSHT